MKNVLIIARKEIQEGIRNRWVLAVTALLAALALSLTFLGSVPTGNVGVRALDVVVVSLSSLSVFLLPLIALLIAHDAIVGEIERGTMLLLLSYPVARWQVVFGKFTGHLAILALATLIGYGAAAGVIIYGEGVQAQESIGALVALIGSSILLGAAFIAIGYLVSALVNQRATAAGIAIGVWLLFVLIYDMALLGVLVMDQGQLVRGGLLNALLLLNPADAYRLYNLSASSGAGALTGMAGVAKGAGLEPSWLLAGLLIWTVVPLAAAAAWFARREI